jgi:hypothetical protein
VNVFNVKPWTTNKGWSFHLLCLGLTVLTLASYKLIRRVLDWSIIKGNIKIDLLTEFVLDASS